METLLLVLSGVLLLASTSVSGRTWYINPDGTGDAPTIQAGIDSAQVGDEVILADGTFTGTGNWDIDFCGKAITLGSWSGNREACIIDGDGDHRGVYFGTGEGQNSVLQGITLRYCLADSGGAIYCGGGSGPTILDCVVQGCWAINKGGGMFCDQASPALSNCLLRSCAAQQEGGAICCVRGSSPMIIDCVIRWNKVSWGTGGGICSYGGGSPTIRSCVVDGNAAGSSLLPCYGVGGGMALSGGTVEDCIIVGNRASDYGGGLSCGSGTDISHCTFQGNESYYAYGGALSVGFASITDCLFSGNSTAGSPAVHVFGSATFQGCLLCNEAFALYVWQWSGPPSAIPTIRNCTFCRNGKGIRMYDGTSLVIENTIVAHTTGSSAIGCGETNDVTITCCDLYANAGGSWVGCLEDQYGINGNFSGCPSFCAAHAGDFHLCDQSPCLPGNHPDGYDCGLIGAWDVGCSCGPTATESTTWGEIKAEFGD